MICGLGQEFRLLSFFNLILQFFTKSNCKLYSSKFQFHVIELSKIETTKGNHYMEKARDEMIKMSRDESER